MIKCLWAVIDPKLDRPCFSSSPPPATLERKPDMRVIRFEYDVADPTPGEVEVVQVNSELVAKVLSREIYGLMQERKSP